MSTNTPPDEINYPAWDKEFVVRKREVLDNKAWKKLLKMVQRRHRKQEAALPISYVKISIPSQHTLIKELIRGRYNGPTRQWKDFAVTNIKSPIFRHLPLAHVSLPNKLRSFLWSIIHSLRHEVKRYLTRRRAIKALKGK